MNAPLRALLKDLYRIAVAAAHPMTCLPPLLPPPPSGQVVLLAAGKAAGSMTEVAEAYYFDQLRIANERVSGVAVARHGYGRHLRRVRVIEAGHPIPDAAGLGSAHPAFGPAGRAGPGCCLVVVISGGASGQLVAAAGRTLFLGKQDGRRA